MRVEDGGFDVEDEEYAEIVGRVLHEEIGRGEGANFVIRRTYEGEIPGFGRADALALFRRLLVGERGAYWTFVVHTGNGKGPEGLSSGGRETRGRTLVGASPEVHVRMSGGTVVMNPISGTYRYPAEGPTPEDLLEFLADGKETEELSMVVDEELKMMCTVGDMGGVVIGPRLKEMAHLAHTEYELRGRSSLDVRDVLRETMFAATVTGSPVQNACRVIERHEVGGRGYYAGLSPSSGVTPAGPRPSTRPSSSGPPTSPGTDGCGSRSARRSYAARTRRARSPRRTRRRPGCWRPSGYGPDGPGSRAYGPDLADDPRVRAALDGRRGALAPFWLRMQERSAELEGHALVVDGEDTFTAMLAHLLRSSGLEVTVRRYDEPGLREAALAHEGPLVLGPGPGDPSDMTDPKMAFLRGLTAEVIRSHRHGVLGVCLGHELIAAELGLEIVRKEIPYQGAQTDIELFGRVETVGFYNSFVARCDGGTAVELAAHGVEVGRGGTGEVHAPAGTGLRRGPVPPGIGTDAARHGRRTGTDGSGARGDGHRHAPGTPARPVAEHAPHGRGPAPAGGTENQPLRRLRSEVWGGPGRMGRVGAAGARKVRLSRRRPRPPRTGGGPPS